MVKSPGEVCAYPSLKSGFRWISWHEIHLSIITFSQWNRGEEVSYFTTLLTKLKSNIMFSRNLKNPRAQDACISTQLATTQADREQLRASLERHKKVNPALDLFCFLVLRLAEILEGSTPFNLETLPFMLKISRVPLHVGPTPPFMTWTLDQVNNVDAISIREIQDPSSYPNC